MPSFTRTLVGIAPLCDTSLTVIFTKHDVKAYDQAGATILKGWCNPGGANDWHFPLIDADHNSNDDSLFPSDDKPTIIPTTKQPLVPLPPPATPVPDSYWDRIKHEKRPAGTVQVLYQERLDSSLISTQDQSKRQCKENGACSNVSNLNTTSSYPCIHPHPLLPTTSSSQATSMYNLPSISALVRLHHVSAINSVPSTWFAAIKSGNYNIFLSLTLHNAMKHCPSSDATIKGHLKQTHQGLCSTKPKTPPSSNRFAPLFMPDTPTTEEPGRNPSLKPTKLPPTN